MWDSGTLVAGRECGECTLCCSVLLIDRPDIQKKAGVPCRHCDRGCTIHDRRPSVCRVFYCAWRTVDIFDENWRPDRSGVFAQLETDGIPPDFALQTGIGLMLVGNPLRTVRQPWFIEFVATGVRMDVPLFLSLPGPPGHQAAKSLLNDAALKAAVAGGPRTAIKQILEQALKRLSSHNFISHVMRHHGQDFGAASHEQG